MAHDLDPAVLERLRRSIPVRLSALGRFIWGDAAITHGRILDALRQGLDISATGEPILWLGDQWCHLTVDDCFFRATAATIHETVIRLRLDDQRNVDIDPAALWDEPGWGLRTTAPARRSARSLSVRFTNRAQMDLAPVIDDDEHGPYLRLHDAEFRLRRSPPPCR